MKQRATATRRAKPGDGRWSDLWRRVRGEFMELPGLSLEADQAARLFGLERAESERILEKLVSEGFLRRTALGAFARNDSRP